MSSWNSQIIPKIASSKNKTLFLSKSKSIKTSATSSSISDRLTEIGNLKVNHTDSRISSYFSSSSPQKELSEKGKGKERQEPIKHVQYQQPNDTLNSREIEPNGLEEDIDMLADLSDDNDSFWQQAANMADDLSRRNEQKFLPALQDNNIDMCAISNNIPKKRKELNDAIDAETPRLESLSVSDNGASSERTDQAKKKRKPMVGEDVFTKESVKNWQEPRIKAWQARHTTPETFYFRFVAPGEGVKTGPWSPAEQALFMKRYNEWITNDYKVGASWGMFSCAIPHRVGYQCMGNYRRLVSTGQLKDDSYEMINGKLKQTNKGKPPGTTVPILEKLGSEWDDEEVKEIEKNVDSWIKEFHAGSAALKKSSSAARSSAIAKKGAPRVLKTTMKDSALAGFMNSMSIRNRHRIEQDSLIESVDPEVAHLQERDWETEWRTRLENYRKFLEPFLNKETRHKYWLSKQEWRRGLTTTEMILRKNTLLLQKSMSSENSGTTTTNNKVQQASLSRFFTGVKKRKIDTPDEFISNVRIPNDLFSGVKQIRPLTKKADPDPAKYTYIELNDMNECTSILDSIIAGSGAREEDSHSLPNERWQAQSSLEGILVDPPWDHYVADGKNDGNCTWDLRGFSNLLEKITKHMTAGMVFVWTPKMIQADVVRTMYSLDCRYVENLVWFKKSVNNVHLDEPSPYFSSTKDILLMFKKGDGFELRHQRSPDVIIDFQRPVVDWIADEYTEPKPPGVYEMIETLLPKAAYDEKIGRGRFLELWAKKKSPRREGWITFHENKSTKSMAKETEIKQECTLVPVKMEPMKEVKLEPMVD